MTGPLSEPFVLQCVSGEYWTSQDITYSTPQINHSLRHTEVTLISHSNWWFERHKKKERGNAADNSVALCRATAYFYRGSIVAVSAALLRILPSQGRRHESRCGTARRAVIGWRESGWAMCAATPPGGAVTSLCPWSVGVGVFFAEDMVAPTPSPYA